MITVFAILYFAHFIQQTATSPPINWETILLALISSGGVVVLIITQMGNVYLAKQKTANDAHLAEVNKANEEAAVKAKEAIANAQSERQQETDLSGAMLQQVRVIGQLSAVSARQADILEKLAEKQTDQHNEASEERRKIMAGIATDVLNVGTDVTSHRRESKEWVEAIRSDIDDLKEDLTLQIGEIMKRFETIPAGNDEMKRLLLEALATNLRAIEELSTRVQVSPPPVVATEPAINQPEVTL